MTQNEFLIGELADRAGTTVRTIRYYLSEGLLPTPNTRGKYAYFTQEHLDRLEVIRRLKALHLPLDEIKQILAVTDEEDIAQMLADQENAQIKLPPPSINLETDQPGKAALDYISKISKARSSTREPNPSIAQDFLALPDMSRREPPSPSSGRETWEHIQLAPGVELTFRRTRDPVIRDQIQQLIQFAQMLFQNKKGGSDEK